MTTLLQRVSDEPIVIIKPNFRLALVIAVLLALAWWIMALYFYQRETFLVWDDQHWTFSQARNLLSTPYQIAGFVNPPWSLIPLIPFTFFPLPIAALLQLVIYFMILTGIVYKHGGGIRHLLLALASPITFFVAMETNIEWIVALAFLVPHQWSIPFLLVKPQVALGYVLTFTRHELIRGFFVTLALVLLSFVFWGFWIPDLLLSIQTNTLHRPVNFAPMVFITLPISFAIGAFLCWRGWRKRDPAQAVIGWLFFVPYIAHYSLLLPYTLFGVRYPRAALLINLVVWFALLRLLLPTIL